MKKINFYSGPAILPHEVLLQAQAAITDFEGMGLSILEISHRAKPFVAVMDSARAIVKNLMKLGDDYEVLFLQGGASSQFYMLPYNLLAENETAGYIDTGTWAHSALTEAKNFGKVDVIASSQVSAYNHIPKQWILSALPYKYIHITTNNTIYGTQWQIADIEKLRQHSEILVADMSSDIFSREIDYSHFDVIYAGAQKNMGIAGTTVVVLRKSILGKVNRAIPMMLDYNVQIENGSMKNTPSVFAVYVSYLTLKWIQQQGLQAIYSQNIAKAQSLYKAIDESAIVEGTVAIEDRSMMNVCWRMKDKTQEAAFAEYAKQQGMVGIEGHRSVGGFRASIYNAMSQDGVDALIETIKKFS